MSIQTSRGMAHVSPGKRRLAVAKCRAPLTHHARRPERTRSSGRLSTAVKPSHFRKASTTSLNDRQPAMAFACRTSAFEVPRPADFLMLEQRSDRRSIAAVRELVDLKVSRRSAGARHVEV